MRALLSIISFVAVMALAFWAYRENYATQTQLKDMAKVQDQIAALRDEIAMQKAEWAYLNRPNRLRDLAAMNFDRLGLMPMTPLQLATVADVTMPVAEPVLITGEVQADGTLSPALVSTEEAQIP
jgi:hypothetical protein